MRKVLRQLVEPLGYEILEAGDSIEAIMTLSENPDTELALIDAEMLGTDIGEFLGRIRAGTSLRNIKCVVVTAKANPNMIDDFDPADVGFLLKPFTPEMLMSKFQELGLDAPLLVV
jgi:CheY-like chemotaxis protein